MIRAQTQPNTELALTVRLDPSCEGALLRVLSTLHRRRCRVTAARFHQDDSGSDRLALRLFAPAARAAQVELWLASLIEVHGVERG